MVPNHLFQLITLTAMEPPISFRADAVRDEQSKILHAIQPLRRRDVLRRTVRGQYGAGTINGERSARYRAGARSRPTRTTETFVALELYIDNWRWADVPFYLRTGKMLPKRETEVTIQFKRAPFVLFRDTPVDTLCTEPARDPHPAGRRHFSQLQCEGAWSAGASRRRQHAVRL